MAAEDHTMDFTSLSPQQVLDLAKPTKEYGKLLETLVPLDLEWSEPYKSLDILRQFVSMADERDQKDAGVDEETLHAPAQDGHSIELKVFRVATTSTSSADEAKPVIVLYFGGGFILGSPLAMADLARALAKRFNAVVIAPRYRLAPEHPFPTGVNDGWDSLHWIAENATGRVGGDPSEGFVVGGISAGGGIANVVAHLARDRGLAYPLTGLWLSAPSVRLAGEDYTRLPEKYRTRLLSRDQPECFNSTVITPGMRKLMSDFLQPDRSSELYAPLVWPTAPGHRGLPKTYSQVCGMDTARDDLLVYDDMLKNDGIETRLDVYAGLPHCFWTSFKNLPESKNWEKDTLEGFEWLLESDAAI